jgi:hypothetical protein
MTNARGLVRPLLFLLACLHGVLATAWAQQPGNTPALDREQVERRIATVGTLIEKSSAARQIEASGDARAMEKRAAARETYRRAREAFQAQELTLASSLLAEASRLMFQAVQSAAPEQVLAPKQESDYATRRESLRALLAAQRRISAEKPGPGAERTTSAIEGFLQEADQLAAQGKLVEARAVLDRGYLLAKAAISSVRSGETLVRSLQFASREEEYRYELDRNDTHRMLVKMLLSGERSNDAMVSGPLGKAARLRGEAESASAQGDFVQGIRLLDESTRELVRAIRSAGVYIPG